MQIAKHSYCLVTAVAASIALMGCTNNSTQGTGSDPAPVAQTDGHDDHDHGEHGHASKGPHHGQLIELGNDEYHAELVHDDDTSTVTIYMLDSTAKEEVPVTEDAVMLNVTIDGKPSQFQLTAKPNADDSQGQASRFEVVDKSLLEALEDEETKGRLSVTIDGKPYVGTIEHHDDHDHEH